MKSRDDLAHILDKKIRSVSSTQQEITYVGQLNDSFNLPPEIASDYLTLRNNITEANDFVLFIFASLLYKDKLTKYFTASEIKEYSKSKFSVDKLKFPLRYKMVQIADDQWVGKITVKEIIKLRDAQVINYNEKAQRTMQRIVANGVEHYQISLNKKAVAGIEDAFESGMYIPNTITLNLPEDTDYSYDEETNELVIKGGDGFHFDILDGYHRYIAISKTYNINHKFDYNMELRIVQFNEDRAKQFIWQEDQKTKMRKMDSDAMNQTAVATKVIARLNGDPTFNLAGQINPNEGVINSPLLYICINTLFCQGIIKKTEELKKIIGITKQLKDTINYITEHDKRYLDKWNKRRTIAVIYAIYKAIPLNKILKEIEAYYDTLCDHPDMLAQYQRSAYSRKDFERLDTFRAERG